MHDAHAPDEKGYELSDVQTKIILWFGIGTVVLSAFGFFASVFIVKYLNARDPLTEYEMSPMATEHQDWVTDFRLQPDPPGALDRHDAEQAHRSASFGVVDQDLEIYHIPVETAMDIVAERGLPKFTITIPGTEE